MLEKSVKYQNKLKVAKKNSINLESDNLNFFFNFNSNQSLILDKYRFNAKHIKGEPIKRLDVSESNFINEITFDNGNDSKDFSTVLKSNVSKNSDSIYYEFVVGSCINKLKRYFPNLIYSFKYINLNADIKKELKDNESSVSYDKFSNIKVNEINEADIYTKIGEGCQTNDISSILFESIPNGLSYDELLADPDYIKYKNIEEYNILFQLYAMLSKLRYDFTHYDLTTENIMFAKIPNNNIIKMTYHVDDEIYSIYTHFIPVVIDYSKSYINCVHLEDKSIIDTGKFNELVCKNNECNLIKNKICNLKGSNPSSSFVDITKPNIRYDLKFINELAYKSFKNANPNIIDSLGNLYFDNIDHIDRDYRNLYKFLYPGLSNQELANIVYDNKIVNKFKEDVSKDILYEYFLRRDTRWDNIVNNKINMANGVDNLKSHEVNSNKIFDVKSCFNWLCEKHTENFIEKSVYGEMTIYADNKDEFKKWSFSKQVSPRKQRVNPIEPKNTEKQVESSCIIV
jgi:hypothetical protein